MPSLTELVRGQPGHPSHPPLTDASIGAYTVGTAMLVLGALGVEERQMAVGGLLAISGGLIVAVPTALTGLLDWLAMERGTPARLAATYHFALMVTATVLFAVAWLLQRPGYLHNQVRTGGWIAAAVAELVLAAGGYIGGTVVFHYGNRVVGARATPVAQALNPNPRGASAPAGDAYPPSTEGTPIHQEAT